jgi:hypothetical protein
MRAIKHKGNIGSIAAKVDGSVGYRVNTPELSNEEKSALFDLQNKNIEILISPFDQDALLDVVEVKKEMDTKTPSQRLRAVLFILWKQNNEGQEIFDVYYEMKINKYIEFLKEKIQDE